MFSVFVEQISQTVQVLANANLVACVQASMNMSFQSAHEKVMPCVNVKKGFIVIKPPKNAYLVRLVAQVMATSLVTVREMEVQSRKSANLKILGHPPV